MEKLIFVIIFAVMVDASPIAESSRHVFCCAEMYIRLVLFTRQQMHKLPSHLPMTAMKRSTDFFDIEKGVGRQDRPPESHKTEGVYVLSETVEVKNGRDGV